MSATRTESAIRTRTAAAIGVAAFAVALGYFALFLSYGINVPDEGALLHGFERIADGQRPYRDVHLGYTPGVYYLHAALQGAFSQSIIPGRIALALTNAAAVGLIGALAYPLCGALPALLAALFYLAAMPVHPGYFAAFNVPYPSWYATLLFVAGLFAVRAHLVRPTRALAFTAGALAALTFAFKPNVGALQLACAMLLVLASLSPAAAARGSSLPAKVWWWATWLAVLACVLAMFGLPPAGRELRFLLLPAFAAALLAARCAHTTGAVADVGRIASHTIGVVAGFVAFTAPWVAWFAARLSFDEVLEKVLFVSSSYTSRFYQPHPPVLLGVCAMVVAYVTASAALRFVPRHRRASVLVFCATALVAALAIVAAASPMIEGFERAVMLPFETRWAYILAVAASLLGVGEAWRATRASPTLVTLAVGAPFLYLHIYPRTDFMHWVTAAPLAMAEVVVLLLLVVRRWTDGGGRPARAAAAALVLSPLALVAYLRLSPALSAVLDLEGGRLQNAAAVALTSQRAPVWNNVGRARGYDALAKVVELVRRNTEPGDTVATFPALDMVSFLSDRDGPYFDGYWFPGWRTHEDEARTVTAMEKHPPRLVVLDTAVQTYFTSAPIYFFQLMEFFESAYRPLARVGSYAVLAHREHSPAADRFVDDRAEPRLEALRSYLDAKLSASQPSTLASVVDDLSDDFIEGYADPLTALLADADPAVRAATVGALRSAGDPKTALALARAAIDGGLDERSRRLALRLASAWADEESAPLWLAHVDDPDFTVASSARTALANMADRAFFRSFWPNGAISAAPSIELTSAQRMRVSQWLRDRNIDLQLKRFAAAYAAEVGGLDEILRAAYGDCAVPTIAALIEEPGTRAACRPERLVDRLGDMLTTFGQFEDIRLRLLWELARRRADSVIARVSVAQAVYEDLIAPRAALASLDRSESADRLLAYKLHDTNDDVVRARLLWVAALRGGPLAAEEALQLLPNAAPELAVAALWSVLRNGTCAQVRDAEQVIREGHRSAQRLEAAFGVPDESRRCYDRPDVSASRTNE